MWSTIFHCMFTTAVITSSALPAPATPEISRLVQNAPESIKFLQRYGYLKGSNNEGAAELLYSNDSVEKALKIAQKFGGIQETGELDEATIQLFNAKRCGMPDVVQNDTIEDSGIRPTEETSDTNEHHNHQFHHHHHHHHHHRRKRRFALAAQGWNKRRLTYYLSNHNYRLNREDVLRELKKALDTWGKVSDLKFSPASNPFDADITAGFFNGYHGDNYPFDGPGSVLAHAFFPQSSSMLAGDIHFDNDEPWVISDSDYDESNSLEQGVDFSTVALHELGHSLGLYHSSEKGSIMNPYYRGKGELGTDDIRAMHKMYKTRKLDDDDDRHRWEYDWNDSNKPKYPTVTYWPPTTRRPSSTRQPSRSTTTVRYNRQDENDTDDRKRHQGKHHHHSPSLGNEGGAIDGCNGNFDTVAMIRGELFIIKDNLLWRLDGPGQIQSGYPVAVHTLFNKLPKSVMAIDAIYQRVDDSSIVIFSGPNYWVFDGYDFIEGTPRPITDYGLPPTEKHVDATVVLNGKTHLFSGDRYWIFNDTSKQPIERHPFHVSDFAGLPEHLDSALSYKNRIYFFKDAKFWTMTEGSDDIKLYPGDAARYWLAC